MLWGVPRGTRARVLPISPKRIDQQNCGELIVVCHFRHASLNTYAMMAVLVISVPAEVI